MYKDYIDQILQDYEQKKSSGILHLNLSAPTPARLRDECRIVCTEKWQRKDEQTLRNFFGKTGDERTYPRIIENFDIDKFRPLINFINNPKIRTDEKNIELLAWLTGFEPRPYTSWEKNGIRELDELVMEVAVPEEEHKPVGEVQEDNTMEGNKEEEVEVFAAKPEAPVKPRFRFKIRTAPLIISVLALLGIPGYRYITWDHSKEDACMYWTGDHYQQIPCNQKVYGALVIPLDTVKLLHFRKVTRPDTITEADINRMSYIRLNGGIEFYTRKGEHPVYTERSLSPLTEHIYEKHILPLK
ncbi:hypothetical protein [Niabella beijingensis]|uniref:hypothetical protein n=1 Tax=Niabella beijingensis TaxID=2872700 RepID=UPI001CBDF4B5|nr:hypothetical protein [Niabella beijingensis]MBZ4192555.1 hypothetical protein [Niabella beijingensis]